MNQERRQVLVDIFKLTPGRVITTGAVTAFVHYYLVAEVLRDRAEEGFTTLSQFWFTNYLDALPYLETDNTYLKFVTFFVCSYLVVWLVTGLITLSENLQRIAVKHLRRTA